MEEKIDTITVADVSRDMGSFVSCSVWGVGGWCSGKWLTCRKFASGDGGGGLVIVLSNLCLLKTSNIEYFIVSFPPPLAGG